jgi:hypothetical protein
VSLFTPPTLSLKRRMRSGQVAFRQDVGPLGDDVEAGGEMGLVGPFGAREGAGDEALAEVAYLAPDAKSRGSCSLVMCSSNRKGARRRRRRAPLVELDAVRQAAVGCGLPYALIDMAFRTCESCR